MRGKEEELGGYAAAPAAQQQLLRKVNWLVLLQAPCASLARTVGAFVLVLATVLVLGGFKWNLKPVDFWLVTCLSIFQPYRTFGGHWWRHLEILYPLPMRLNRRLVPLMRFFLESLPSETVVSGLVHFRWACLMVLVCACMMLSIFRLAIHKFGNTNQNPQDTILNPVLKLFYSLLLAQAVLSFYETTLSVNCMQTMQYIRQEYALDLGDRPLQLYSLHVMKMCRDGEFSRTMSTTLASFALDTLSSKEPDARLDATRVLRSLLRAPRCKEVALAEVRDSPDAIDTLFRMIALTGQDPTSRATRKEASMIVAELAANLRISGSPRSVQSVCSLLQDGGEDDELMAEGLKILEGLSNNNTDNLVQLSNSAELMYMITDIVSQWEVNGNTEKAKSSLTVIGRFTGAAGRQGNTLRRTIWEDEQLMATVREMLQDPDAHGELRKLAIDAVAGFALDDEARKCGATRKAFGVLLSIFCDPPREEAMPNDQVALDDEQEQQAARLAEQVRLAAGNALVGLTTESGANCAAILQRGRGYLESLQHIYNEQHAVRRAVAAKILRNMCNYLNREALDGHGIMDFYGGSISAVLTTIYGTANLVGEVMEAFLGVALHLCKAIIPRTEFAAALNGIGSENFVRKLKSVLDEANARPRAAADWLPGIRRSAIELAIWMMQSEGQLHCIHHFIRYEMRQSLVAVRPEKEENYKLLSGCGVPVLEHEESLSSLVRIALRVIPGPQIGQ
ncbi:unnamed protein product [Urochloa decumbens]|uniref:Uncharacterized protein n=1 Tax=Urochloa decumbens TaxID=240449 RepID=A0ABC8YEU8_9POAL